MTFGTIEQCYFFGLGGLKSTKMACLLFLYGTNTVMVSMDWKFYHYNNHKDNRSNSDNNMKSNNVDHNLMQLL